MWINAGDQCTMNILSPIPGPSSFASCLCQKGFLLMHSKELFWDSSHLSLLVSLQQTQSINLLSYAKKKKILSLRYLAVTSGCYHQSWAQALWCFWVWIISHPRCPQVVALIILLWTEDSFTDAFQLCFRNTDKKAYRRNSTNECVIMYHETNKMPWVWYMPWVPVTNCSNQSVMIWLDVRNNPDLPSTLMGSAEKWNLMMCVVLTSCKDGSKEKSSCMITTFDETKAWP